MTHLSKAVLLIACVALAACAGPNRFGSGADAFDDPVIPGSTSDPNSPAYFQQTVGDRVFFAVDQSTLSAQAQAVLDGQIDWMTANPDYSAVIEGHADEQGTREYNLALGARRANAVMEYMVSQGVAQSRLRFVTFGKERPVAVCSAESCYSENRRAVTVLSAGTPSG